MERDVKRSTDWPPLQHRLQTLSASYGSRLNRDLLCSASSLYTLAREHGVDGRRWHPGSIITDGGRNV
jgi:hypothetical protein